MFPQWPITVNKWHAYSMAQDEMLATIDREMGMRVPWLEAHNSPSKRNFALWPVSQSGYTDYTSPLAHTPFFLSNRLYNILCGYNYPFEKTYFEDQGWGRLLRGAERSAQLQDLQEIVEQKTPEALLDARYTTFIGFTLLSLSDDTIQLRTKCLYHLPVLVAWRVIILSYYSNIYHFYCRKISTGKMLVSYELSKSLSSKIWTK